MNPWWLLLKEEAVKVSIRRFGEQADGRNYSKHSGNYHGWLKRKKHRLERHRARRDPEAFRLMEGIEGMRHER